MLRSTNLRCVLGLVNQFRSSSTAPTVAAADKPSEEPKNRPSRMVSAAFASLKSTPESNLDEAITSAKTAESLLKLSETAVLSKKQTHKIVTTLAEWAVTGQTIKKDLEADSRFVAMCQTLGKTQLFKPPKSDDLSVVMDITGDDEAAKLVSTITLPQKIKVILSLAHKKRRSLVLLRSLSHHIGRATEKLDVKQGADILFALASLNYPDELLIEKVCSDLLTCIPECKKSSVIGSISTSIGYLKYKDADLLDCIVDWMTNQDREYRDQDVVSVLLTLAAVDHKPDPKFFKITSKLNMKNSPSGSTWLDIVWAMSVLDQANDEHLESVLSSQFTDRLSSSCLNQNPTWKKKILNINALAKFRNNYAGATINPESLQLVSQRSKEKEQLASSVIDSLSNLFPSSHYLKTNVETGMGFIMDAECCLDGKVTPMAIVDRKTGAPIPFKPGKGLKKSKKSGSRIAIMVMDYHDHTRGQVGLCGSASLSVRLLTLSGYRVLVVPHSDYNPRDKLTDRVLYLEKQLKDLVNQKS